ncbi:MAG: carbohydrate ABC transporter permease [Bacillota bacterium]|jgi:multiple sugar transport system permease protein|nr:carbohydrate ABC transporter permease [Bacillota bacterium]HHT91547.1 carbohydrate ABC transporter permease [Bacillota bacterium]
MRKSLLIKKLSIHFVLLVMGAAMVLPFAWMVSTSLKGYHEIFRYPPQWFPDTAQWKNYLEVWKLAPFGRFYVNSLIAGISTTAGQVITGVFAAYAFARMEFWGRDKVFMLFLATMMVPTQVTLIPTYIVMSKIGWIDSFEALIIPFISSAFSVFLLRQFFLTIPKELEDAAIVDGCSKMRFIFRILMALAKPAIASVSLFAFLGSWNSYLWPLIVINSNQMRTLPIGLRYFVSQQGGGSEWHYLMAASLIVMLPVLIVFFLAQKQFIEGIAKSGIKG